MMMTYTINRDYLQTRNATVASRGAGNISYIVIHYVGATGSARNNAVYFAGNNLGASAHYFIPHGTDAQPDVIYQSVDDRNIAWHCGTTGTYYHSCRNSTSIGIELCCKKDSAGNWYFDEHTVQLAAQLVRDLMAKYNIPVSNVIRHYDVTRKVCPAPYVNNTAAWDNFKALLQPQSQELTYEQFRAYMLQYEREIEALSSSEWAAEAWQAATEAGVFDGTMPQSPLTREQAALVLQRLGLIDA